MAGDGTQDLRGVDDPRAPLTLRTREGRELTLPPVWPEWLGERSFCETHGVRFAYVVGEMARGLATPAMVVAGVKAGFAAFYGSAGLPPETVAAGLSEIEAGLGKGASGQFSQGWGANLIHSPQHPGLEAAIVDLFLARGVARVSASAFMRLSPEIVRYSAKGLSRGADGRVVRTTHVFAKISRAETAIPFMSPAPDAMLRELAASGRISPEQAELAARVPVACDITAEADSGGHTDNRAAGPLFASIVQARREVCARQGWEPDAVRIGLAGGLGTPHAVAAAFSMGAAYVLTGSVNQSAVESGLSPKGREMLAKAGPADVIMTPAADMFEQGVKVQVLKRGTLFGPRGNRLAELYRAREGLEALSDKERAFVEECLGESLEAAWEATAAFTAKANPGEYERALSDPKKRMALVFRRYLFMGAHWAREGRNERAADFQIWCGPAMGAFNEWVKGSGLEPLEGRSVAAIGWNLMEGAARLIRAQQARAMGADVLVRLFDVRPVDFGAAGGGA